MTEQSIAQQVERLAEALVFTNLGDLSSLAELHSDVQHIEEWASAHERPTVAKAMNRAADLIEQIILNEIADPEAALDVLNKTAACLQSIVRDDRDAEPGEFPSELDGSSAEEMPEETPSPEVGPGGFVQSSMVDESILAEFVARQPSVLDDMENLILELEQSGSDATLGELRRLLHTLKGEAALVGFADVERVCHVAEDALSECGHAALSDALLEIKDWFARVFQAYQGQGPNPESGSVYVDRLQALRTGSSETASAGIVAEIEGGAPPESAEETLQYLTGDPDLLSEFVTEAQEHLENSDVQLLTVETEPHDQEALNTVFRAFHTIKGVAGFIELPHIQGLAHEAENLLDKARKGEVELTGSYMDVTFDAVDMMKRLVQHVSDCLGSGAPLPSEPGLTELTARLQAAVAGQPLPTDKEDVVPSFSDEDEPPKPLGEVLVESGKLSPEALNAALQKQAESGGEPVGELLIRQSYITRKQLDEALARQKANGGSPLLGEILLEQGMITQAALEETLARQMNVEPPKLGEVLVREQQQPAKEVAQALRGQQRQPGAEVRESVRVDSDRLDRLVDLIGELVIAESMVSQSDELLANASPQTLRQLGQLDKITRELQEMGMSLRMVPVRATFQKMARLVRDLARKSGKKVDFFMEGEDTELDKTVVDKIGDPLVHMVRNAVDHGLEATPQDRVAAGKSETGTITLRAYHKGGGIYIEIQDDGRGLDRDTILRKGIERGIVRESDTLTDREICNLIFEPGFSTAKQITDVSGRGVGMDVVRRNIEALRGQVEIQSEAGKGSTFSIRLPLTLAIIDGMVIRVGDERYILPTLSVVRSIRPEDDNLFTVVEKGEMISLQGELVPLFRLERLFNIQGAEQDLTRALVVIVEDDGKQAGIIIDELLGQQQTVIKPLGESMRGIPGLAGAAIMSDGRVGLIVDIGGLVRLANTGGRSKLISETA